jgi:glycine/D-amino acid oxidase-like deaminating enzyme
MQTDVLIVGQGICGTFLSWNLRKAGLSFLIIDEYRPGSASRIASGVINPVTGRRMVKTWLIEELLECCRMAYSEMGDELKDIFISQKNIIDQFATVQMQQAFAKRSEEEPQLLEIHRQAKGFENWFKYEYGYGEIKSGYLVNLSNLLTSYRKKIARQSQLLEEKFSFADLVIHKGGVTYHDIQASWIIFCDGIESYSNPWFKNLPFAPNKGEVLVVESSELPTTHIFKKGIYILPWKENLFWVGSSHQWQFADDRPTEFFLRRTGQILKDWLKFPFSIVDHLASVRPATLERRPFVGFHPQHQNLGILNGMGTKGCSLAPYFSDQLVRHMTLGSGLSPEADIHRFENILRKTSPFS